MQELYIIRKTACHKPWRYSSIIYTTNGQLFHYLKDERCNNFFPEIDWSNYPGYEDEEDDDFADNLLDSDSVIPLYPFIVLGEVEVFVE